MRAAERLFRDHGSAKTTVGDIAREVGIGVGTVYLEFESKHAIVDALSQIWHASVLSAMRAARADDAAMRLHCMLEARVRVLFELAAQGAHACDFVLCKSAQAEVGHFSREEAALLAAALDDGQRSGAFDIADLDATSRLLQRALTAYSPPWLFAMERERALVELQQLAELLLNGLKRR